LDGNRICIYSHPLDAAADRAGGRRLAVKMETGSRKMFDVRELTADVIKQIVIRDMFTAYHDFKALEFTPYHTDIRFDFIALDRAQRLSRIVEVKSSRADFLSDHKWEKYLPYATHFYFAAPQGMIKPDELPPNIGLAEVITLPHGYKQIQYTRRCRKLHDLTDKAYMKLIEGAFMRYRNERDYMEKQLKQMEHELRETKLEIERMRNTVGKGE